MLEQAPARRLADLTVHTEYDDGVAIVHPNGDVDRATCELLDGSLAVLDRDVIVDLTGVTFLDSSAVALLVTHRRRLDQSGWMLRLVNPSKHVRGMLTIVGLDAWVEY